MPVLTIIQKNPLYKACVYVVQWIVMKNMPIQPVDTKTVLKTYYEGPDKEPVVETFSSMKEAMALASSRSREGLAVEILREENTEKDA